MLIIKCNTETDVFKYSYLLICIMSMIFSWTWINSVETITFLFLHIPFVFVTYFLTDMIMSWYENGFHITAPFVKEFHNALVDSPRRGPVMQSFSVSFVVSLNKLLNHQFSCWWFERLCHCKVTHLCDIMVLLQNIFCYFVYLSIWIHARYKTYFFGSLMFSHLVCWTKWWMNYWGEVSWSTARVGGCWESPWHLIFSCPASCMPHQHPSDCG